MSGEYGVIVVGAGSAGAVLAARLTEDAERSVLLLEAGPDYPDLATMPTDLTDGTMASLDAHDWHWSGNAVSGRAVPYARGKVTGGSSAVNGIVAIRGVPEDYDEWAALGNPAWSWESCLPFFRKLEDDRDQGGDFHGSGGPIPIVRWRDEELTPLQAAFRESCRGAGYPDSDDHNTPGSTGVGSWAMNRAGGMRVSTAIGYLNPARPRLNLTIRADCLVERVVVEGGRAVGLDVQHDGRTQRVRGKEIVLAAGTLHTPPLLLRSGVGPAEHLREVGAEVVHDLPGVGENLIDHPSVTLIAAPKSGVAQPGDPLQQMGLRYTAAASDELNDMQMYMWSYESQRVPQMRIAIPGFDFLFMLCVTLQRPRSAGRIRLATPEVGAPAAGDHCRAASPAPRGGASASRARWAASPRSWPTPPKAPSRWRCSTAPKSGTSPAASRSVWRQGPRSTSDLARRRPGGRSSASPAPTRSRPASPTYALGTKRSPWVRPKCCPTWPATCRRSKAWSRCSAA